MSNKKGLFTVYFIHTKFINHRPPDWACSHCSIIYLDMRNNHIKLISTMWMRKTPWNQEIIINPIVFQQALTLLFGAIWKFKTNDILSTYLFKTCHAERLQEEKNLFLRFVWKKTRERKDKCERERDRLDKTFDKILFCMGEVVIWMGF